MKACEIYFEQTTLIIYLKTLKPSTACFTFRFFRRVSYKNIKWNWNCTAIIGYSSKKKTWLQCSFSFISFYFLVAHPPEERKRKQDVAGASPAGGQCPPDFRFCPPDFRYCPPRFISCPPQYFLGRKKLLVLAGKNVWICDFGEDFFFLEITCFWPEKTFEFVILARKSLRISAKIFFFLLEITCF